MRSTRLPCCAMPSTVDVSSPRGPRTRFLVARWATRFFIPLQPGVRTLREAANRSQSLVTGIFWEPFSAARAITALLRRGFPDEHVRVLGFLGGHPPAIREFLAASNVPSEITASYIECLHDGAVLVMVDVDDIGHNQHLALDLIKRYGGAHTRHQHLPAV